MARRTKTPRSYKTQHTPQECSARPYFSELECFYARTVSSDHIRRAGINVYKKWRAIHPELYHEYQIQAILDDIDSIECVAHAEVDT